MFFLNIQISIRNLALMSDLMNTRKETSTGSGIDLSGLNILIAEDDGASKEFLRALLEGANAKVQITNNGQKVLDLLEKVYFDILLMDINMPVMDGLEATRLIRKSGNAIPIIAQTAYAYQNDAKACFTAGCSAYISKPYKSQKLLTLIHSLTR